MNKTKRLFSVVLAVFMVCQVMMVGSFAADDLDLTSAGTTSGEGYDWNSSSRILTLTEGNTLKNTTIMLPANATVEVESGTAVIGNISQGYTTSTITLDIGENNTLECSNIYLIYMSLIVDSGTLVADYVGSSNDNTQLIISEGAVAKIDFVGMGASGGVNGRVTVLGTLEAGTIMTSSLTVGANATLKLTGASGAYGISLGKGSAINSNLTIANGANLIIGNYDAGAILVRDGTITIPANYLPTGASVFTFKYADDNDKTYTTLVSNTDMAESIIKTSEAIDSTPNNVNEYLSILANCLLGDTTLPASSSGDNSGSIDPNTYEDKDESPNYYTITVTTEGDGTVTSNTQEKSTYSIYQYTNRNFVFDGNVAAVYVDGKLVEDAEEGYYFTFVHDDHTLEVVFGEESVEVGKIVVEVKANPSTGAVA